MKNTSRAAALVAVTLCAAAALLSQGAQAQNLVIQGGTLIDGTGRAPIENSVIVIDGNRIKAVGRSGEVAVPPGAGSSSSPARPSCPDSSTVIAIWKMFRGEIYLHLGITTCMEIETQQNGPWALAQKEGTEMGKIRGPRIWATGQASAPAKATSRLKARAPGAAT